ncbi:hypothetical protein ATCM_02000 [Stenotrophomonas sp. ATCM1_4]|nr:hypothetical protein ATCM_02000 [Stenotrophomonas sp. ATCM1_4]
MPHPSDRLKLLIQSNAEEVAQLHARVHETFAQRDRSPDKRQEWERACEIFHSRYNELAFPGGFEEALDRIVAGDAESMEAAICFLELRPYFFRSGYMFESILRRAKRAPLSQEQVARLQHVIQALAAWRSKRATANGA